MVCDAYCHRQGGTGPPLGKSPCRERADRIVPVERSTYDELPLDLPPRRSVASIAKSSRWPFASLPLTIPFPRDDADSSSSLGSPVYRFISRSFFLKAACI